MEVLDRVYNAFANLDRDFAKSKKTRAVFIADKFGGDIDIGSTIILDAISSGTGEEKSLSLSRLSRLFRIFSIQSLIKDKIGRAHV